MSEWCMKFHVETWAYCLPNHHQIVVPETKDGLNLASVTKIKQPFFPVYSSGYVHQEKMYYS